MLDFKPFKMGKYLLLERLATGGMAEVYRARAQGAGGFEKQVAIKRILPTYSQNEEFRKMFEYEARLSSALTHANIVQIYDFNKFAETYLLAMEFVDGKNLRQFVNKCKKVNVTYPIEFSVFVVNEVCKGLEYAHAKKDDMGKPLNIIHRDMSPQNIMLSYEGAVKIVDFGIAKAKDRVDETRSGIIKGKFGYMSPEQANGLPVDHRTDLFSTGIILWEMLTGRRLFTADSDMATLRMIQECVITPPSKINPRVTADLERIVMKVLSKDLKLRYNSAGDMHRSLLEYLSKHAPTYTQREVSGTLVKAFAEEIRTEKKRFEQLNRQSIPFSQGVKSKKEDNSGMSDVADVLDGMDTKSDIVEQTGETFSDENKVDSDPEAPELSRVGSREATEVSDLNPTSISYSQGGEEESSDAADELSRPTRSEIVAAPPAEEQPEPDEESAPQEASANTEESTEGEPADAKKESTSINLSHSEVEADIVLPGGRRHTNNREVEPEAPPEPGKKWKGANIMPMGGSETDSEADLPVATEAAEPQTHSGVATKGGETPTEAAPTVAPVVTRSQRHSHAPMVSPASGAKIDLSVPHEAPVRERFPIRTDVPRDAAWNRRPMQDNRAAPRRKKRLMHPVIPLIFLLGMTGYVYKLYIDGAVTDFIENNSHRDPTQNGRPSAVDELSEDVAPVDRKPVGDCTLDVRSQPPGAEVSEDGKVRGLTPLVLSGPCNRSTNIVLKKEGFEYLSENVVISPKNSEWNRALKSIPTGLLVLDLAFNAEVFVNGEKVRDVRARVPLEYPLRARRTHNIRLVNSTLKVDVETPVSIEEGQNNRLSLGLEEALARTGKPTRKK